MGLLKVGLERLQVLHQQRRHLPRIRFSFAFLHLFAHQGEGVAASPRTPGTAHASRFKSSFRRRAAMRVRLDVSGHVVGHHGADGGDVQPSGRHVGGDQQVPERPTCPTGGPWWP